MKKKSNQNDIKINHIKYLFKMHKHKEVLKEIDDYLLEFPHDYYVHVFKGMVLSFENRIDEAKKILNDVLNHNADEPIKQFAYEQLASIAYRENDRKEAIKQYEKVVNSSNLVCLKARKELSILYFDEGRDNDAINILEVTGFNDENLNVARANVYYKKNDYTKALEALERPFCNDVNLSYAKLYDMDDNKNKSHAQGLYLKGNIYSRSKKYKEAMETYKEGLRCTNNNQKVYYDLLLQLAVVYYKLGEYYKAIEACKEIINSDFHSDKASSTYVLMCNCHIKSGNIEKFYPILEQCSDLKIRNLCKVQIYVSKFDFYNAINLFPFCDMDNYSALFSYLVIMYRLDRYEDFMTILKAFKSNKEYTPLRKSATEVERMRLYMEYDRGITNINTLSYADGLYKEYSSAVAINHIKCRHAKEELETEFSKDIDIEELYNYVYSRLDTSDFICDNLYNEYYVKVDYPYMNGVGEQIRYIGVICIPNTKKIITMYPIVNYVSEKENYIPKVKKKEKLSRSEMFNKKYGL